MKGIGGTAGVQLIGYSREEGMQIRNMTGFMCIFDSQATSAFQMELLGLKTGLELVAAAAQ